jgi:glycosyltransferase involved in cell wall biosynthesis
VRVAFLSPSAELGGAERCLLDLVAALRASDRGLRLVALVAGEGPLVDRLAHLGIPAEVVSMAPALERSGEGSLRRTLGAAAAALQHTRGLAASLRRLRPDLVHTNGMKHHLLGALAAAPGMDVVWHVRDLPGRRRLLAPALRLARRRAAGAFAISRLVRDDLARVLPGLRTEIVYDAIDLDEFSPGPGDPARLDALAGMSPAPPGTVRVGLVATYARWKGQELFLDAAARLAPATPGARFFLVGGPIYRTAGSQWSADELSAAARSRGLGDRLGLVPFQREPAWVFRSLDVVVHASTAPEPFGRTIAEAMACARPVVASRASGAAEAVEDGRDALLVPPGDPGALAGAVRALVADPARRSAMGAAASAAARRAFGRERLGREVLEAWAKLGVLRAR